MLPEQVIQGSTAQFSARLSISALTAVFTEAKMSCYDHDSYFLFGIRLHLRYLYSFAISERAWLLG